MAEVFRRRSDGVSFSELANFLEEKEAITAYGNRGWTPQRIAQMLANRTYLGELRSGDFLKTGAHQPLVDAATWAAAQSPRRVGPRFPGRPTLLGGLVRCAGCRMVLRSGGTTSPDGKRRAGYVCGRRSSAGRCPAPAMISGTLIEPYIEDIFFRTLEGWQTRRRRRSRLSEHHAAADKAEQALIAYRDNPNLVLTLGPDSFAKGIEIRQERLAIALQRVAAERRRLEEPGLPNPDVLQSDWASLAIEERRTAISEVIDCVFLSRGKFDVAGRTFVCYRGEAPLDLPRPGTRHTLKSFDLSQVEPRR
jgi:hypothetical protein